MSRQYRIIIAPDRRLLLSVTAEDDVSMPAPLEIPDWQTSRDPCTPSEAREAFKMLSTNPERYQHTVHTPCQPR